MRFLIDASLPRRNTTAIQACGHEAIDVRDVGLGAAADRAIAEYARQQALCLITRDFDFADIRHYPPKNFAGLIVLDLPHRSTSDQVIATVTKFIQEQDLSFLSGRLAIVGHGRVRFRPSP